MTIHEAAEKLFTECFPASSKKECAFRMIAENAYAWDSGLLHWECVQVGVLAVMHSYFNPDRSEPALRRAYRMDADSLTEIPPEKLARLLPGSAPAVEQDPVQPDSETETLRALRTEKEAETKALQAQRWKEWEKKRKEEASAVMLQQIIESDEIMLLPKDVAEVLGCKPDSINAQAQNDPNKLGFPVCVMGTRVTIPRQGFLHWLQYGNAPARGK